MPTSQPSSRSLECSAPMKPSSSLIAEIATMEAISLRLSSLKSISRDRMRPAVTLAHHDRRDEVRIAGKKDDDDERGRQSQVDNRQFRQQNLFVVEGRKRGEEIIEMEARLCEKGEKADGERKIERNRAGTGSQTASAQSQF